MRFTRIRWFDYQHSRGIIRQIGVKRDAIAALLVELLRDAIMMMRSGLCRSGWSVCWLKANI